ncbi:MAG: hypothetical protein H7067_18060 [Burkholderiales bacterium]|nr:hypothetical protein [Opitutaceae bacterium]
MSANNPWRLLTPLRGVDPTDRELLRQTRADELKQITSMIGASRASILYASSGNGKTSLLQAGIVPHFEERGYMVVIARPRPLHCTDSPSRALKQAIYSKLLQREGGILEDMNRTIERLVQREGTALSDFERQATLTQVAATATALQVLLNTKNSPDSYTILEWVRLGKALLPQTPLLIVCDQLEETFLHFQDSIELGRFVDALGEVWNQVDLRVTLLFSLREDWVGRMIEFRRVIPSIFSNCHRLLPLTRDGARLALTLPLASTGMDWEQDAIDLILDELTAIYRDNGTVEGEEKDGSYIELPALQIVAFHLWKTRTDFPRPFSIEHYKRLSANLLGNLGGIQAVNDPSIAKCILRSFIVRTLAGDNEQELFSGAAALRLDCLWALTDRICHRRALPCDQLRREVAASRAESGEPTPEDLCGELQPLVAAGLVLSFSANPMWFELAHDYLARALVPLARELERHRLDYVARASERDRLRGQALVRTEAFARRAWRVLNVLPVIMSLAASILIFFIHDQRGRESKFLDQTAIIACLASCCALLGATAVLVVIAFAVWAKRLIVFSLVALLLLVGGFIAIFQEGDEGWLTLSLFSLYCLVLACGKYWGLEPAAKEMMETLEGRAKSGFRWLYFLSRHSIVIATALACVNAIVIWKSGDGPVHIARLKPAREVNSLEDLSAGTRHLLVGMSARVHFKAGEEDAIYYSFDLMERGRYVLKTLSSGEDQEFVFDPELSLLDRNFAQIEHNDDNGSDDNLFYPSIERTLEPGTYVVKIASRDRVPGSCLLRLDRKQDESLSVETPSTSKEKKAPPGG